MNIGEKLSDFWNNFTGSAEIIVALSVSVLVFAVLYFYMIKFLLDNNSGGLVSVFVLSMILGAAIISLSNMNSAIFLVIPAIYLVIIIVLYSVELKEFSRLSIHFQRNTTNILAKSHFQQKAMHMLF